MRAHEIYRFKIVFAVSLFFLFASKGAAFIPGYAADDLFRFYYVNSGSFFASQGRFTEALSHELILISGLDKNVAWWTSLVFIFPLVAYSISLLVHHISSDETPI